LISATMSGLLYTYTFQFPIISYSPVTIYIYRTIYPL
jgi:hypothetical protein